MKSSAAVKTMEGMRAWLEARCVRDGKCLVWSMSTRDGVPQANLFDPETGKKGTFNVRREAWRLRVGRPPRKGYVIVCTCETGKCVEPEHLKEISRSQLHKGKPKSEAHRLAIAKAAKTKKNAKLSDEALQDIRTSDDPLPVCAARHGVSVSHVSGIRLGKWCKEVVANPFAGLYGRVSEGRGVRSGGEA